MFGIRFKPAGITAFTRVPVEEFTDRMVELALVETLFGASFCEALAEKRSVAEMVACADAYLIRLLPRAYGFDRQIVRAVDLICFSEGRISPVAVADDICLCQRHFERKFKAAIGVSPKLFANVFRFKRALRLLKNDPHKDLLTLAVECGYYDQSHLIRDFKRLSGDAPADFRR
jgi:transcriptional regulator GlxA family with amidase domain